MEGATINLPTINLFSNQIHYEKRPRALKQLGFEGSLVLCIRISDDARSN